MPSYITGLAAPVTWYPEPVEDGKDNMECDDPGHIHCAILLLTYRVPCGEMLTCPGPHPRCGPEAPRGHYVLPPRKFPRVVPIASASPQRRAG